MAKLRQDVVVNVNEGGALRSFGRLRRETLQTRREVQELQQEAIQTDRLVSSVRSQSVRFPDIGARNSPFSFGKDGFKIGRIAKFGRNGFAILRGGIISGIGGPALAALGVGQVVARASTLLREGIEEIEDPQSRFNRERQESGATIAILSAAGRGIGNGVARVADTIAEFSGAKTIRENIEGILFKRSKAAIDFMRNTESQAQLLEKFREIDKQIAQLKIKAESESFGALADWSEAGGTAALADVRGTLKGSLDSFAVRLATAQKRRAANEGGVPTNALGELIFDTLLKAEGR